MSARTELLLSLRKEVLGPRESCYEILPSDQDPRNEFISGILIPKNASDTACTEPGDAAEVLGTGTDGWQDDDAEEEIPVVASPSLDPKSLPRSLGISFIISDRVGSVPHIEICATWARYKAEEKPIDGFRRLPNYYITANPVNATQSQIVAVTDQVQLSLRSVLVNATDNGL